MSSDAPELTSTALADIFAQVAVEAGAVVMDVYGRDFDVRSKADRSPVCDADERSESLIVARLAAQVGNIPVVAEEAVARGLVPDLGSDLILVDPLDGTKEFVRGGDDYTVNIGLIVDGTPVLGVVYQPALDRLHLGLVGTGAWLEEEGARSAIRTRALGEVRHAVASKSHYNQATADYLDQAIGACERVSVGSSLKFCLVAEGRADIYPRLSPTSEWDTAAGHAVLLAAGGRVDGLDGEALAYGKRAFLNPGFVATAGWQAPPIGPYMVEFGGGGDLPQGV